MATIKKDGKVVFIGDRADFFRRLEADGLQSDGYDVELDKTEKAVMRKAAQLAGVEFIDPVSGKTVMCSATGDDQAGLSAVFLKHSLAKMAGETLPDMHFRFANGNVLTLNAGNIDAMDAVWTPFRLSFFPPAGE